MPLSNYLPTSAVAKPGVCTSTTRPASPYDGQVIWETDTEKTLVWNGSAWVYLSTSTANPVGLELIKSQTATSGTSVQVDDVFSSTYENYKIVISDARTSSSLAGIALKLKNSSGVSSTSYYWAFVYVQGYGTNTVLANSGANSASWDFGSVITTIPGGSTVDLFSPFLARETSFASCPTDVRTGGRPPAQASGFHNSATSYTGVEISSGSGVSFANINIRVYGYRN